MSDKTGFLASPTANTAPQTAPQPDSASAQLNRLAALGTERRYRKGTVIIAEGDSGDLIFIVKTGGLRAFSGGDGGTTQTGGGLQNNKEITYGIYGPGDYVGEMSLDGGPRSASVITTTATVCSAVTRHTLRQFIAQEPDFAFELLARVIRRARLATLSAKKLALVDVYGRLADTLRELAGPPNEQGHRSVAAKTTHADLASRIGASREMVSRILKDLERGGYVQTEGRVIVLLKGLPARW